jgi:VWFA-related protein
MHRRTINKALVLGFAALPRGLRPQQPASPAEDYVVRSDVNMVVVHATVQDNKGGFIRGLTKESFNIEEDGVKQTITVFTSDDVPVAVGIVIDNSGSMMKRHSEVVVGALTFIQGSRPEDEMFVVNFNDTVEMGLPEDRPFSNNVVDLRQALMKGRVGGQTALYDGLARALDHFEKASRMKKVVLLVSDGGDNRSQNRLDDIVQRADRAGVLIYAIGIFDEMSEDKNPGVLRDLAKRTGGLAYLPHDLSLVRGICSQIALDIRNQYTVGYMSSKGDGAYHELKVTAVDSRGRRLRVRSRTGFAAAKAPATGTEPQPRPSQR